MFEREQMYVETIRRDSLIMWTQITQCAALMAASAWSSARFPGWEGRTLSWALPTSPWAPCVSSWEWCYWSSTINTATATTVRTFLINCVNLSTPQSVHCMRLQSVSRAAVHTGAQRNYLQTYCVCTGSFQWSVLIIYFLHTKALYFMVFLQYFRGAGWCLVIL